MESYIPDPRQIWPTGMVLFGTVSPCSAVAMAGVRSVLAKYWIPLGEMATVRPWRDMVPFLSAVGAVWVGDGRGPRPGAERHCSGAGIQRFRLRGRVGRPRPARSGRTGAGSVRQSP